MLETAPQGLAALALRLVTIRARHPAADPDMVADVVRAVLTTMRGDLTAQESSLLSEVEELGRTIASARAEIAAIDVDDINVSHIPSATDQLDAIIAHTAAATNSILEVCETLDRVANDLQGEQAIALQDATTRIYEACGFQDITGQRITKVVATLKTIDAKVAHIVGAFGERIEGMRARVTSANVVVKIPVGSDAALLHGPQMPDSAMDQSEIDKLLASFD